MKRLLLVLLICCSAAAQAQDVVVRSKLVPGTGAVVGQHVRVLIDVLFPGDMPRPPRVAIGDVPGAQLLHLETQGTTISDTVDGRSYTGQRFEFALYARRGGTIVVPPASVTQLNAGGEPSATAGGQELRIAISVPPGVDPSGPVIASGRMALEEQWAPSPTSAFKAGDAIVRTITRTVDDVPAMAMRDLDFPAPPGVRVYRDRPEADDHLDRGGLVGRRVDRVTYVFEAGGAVRLPAVVQPWWDLSAASSMSARGEGVSVSVAAAAPQRNWRLIGTGAACVLAVAGMLAWAGVPRILSAWRAHRQRWRQSERRAFRDLSTACRTGDVTAIYRAFGIWRRHGVDPAAVAPVAEDLEQALFGAAPAAAWSRAQGRAFGERLEAMRRAILTGARDRRRPSALPPLNPRHRARHAGTARAS